MDVNLFKGLCAAVGIIMLIYYGRRKKPFSSAVFGMISGCAALVIFHYAGKYVGFSPAINMFNTAVSLVLGAPGAALIMAVNMI